MTAKTIYLRGFVQTVSVLGSLNLGACMFWSPSAPEDLKFVSIKVVETNNLPDLVQHDIGWYKFNRFPRKVLEVSFSSNSNVIEYRKYWGDAYITTVICREWKNLGKFEKDSFGGSRYVGALVMATSDVYWHDVNVINRPVKSIPEEKARPFIYHFYIDISRESEYQPPAKYDLRAHVEDVCFQMTSAEMMRPGAKTNVVVIPKEAIAAVLTATK